MRALKLIFQSILLLTFLSFLFLSILQLNPSLMGYDYALTIKGGSMKPTLKPGDLILITKVNPQDIHKGDIVTVERPEGTYTHRVVEVKEYQGDLYFRTKGDANNAPDPVFTPSNMIKGKLKIVIPLHHIYTPYGLSILIILPVTLLSLNIFWKLYKNSERRSRRKLALWKKHKPPLMDAINTLLILIVSIASLNVVSPIIKGGSITEFTDIEEALIHFQSGEWLVTHEATIDLKPDTLHLESEGNPITCYIELSGTASVYDIDPSTILLEGVIPAEPKPVGYDDYDGDDIEELKVQFNRISVIEYLLNLGCGHGDTVKLTVTGKLTNGDLFQGSDTINLILKEENPDKCSSK